MLFNFRSLLVALLLLIPGASNADTEDFEELIEIVRSGLIEASRTIEENSLPQLKSIELKVLVEITTEVEGGLNLYFVNIGGSGGSASVSSITLSFERVDPAARTPTSGNSQKVADAIVRAASAAQVAQEISPGVALSEVAVQLSFVVTREGKTGLDLDIGVVGVGTSGSLQRDDENEIRLVFGDA